MEYLGTYTRYIHKINNENVLLGRRNEFAKAKKINL